MERLMNESALNMVSEVKIGLQKQSKTFRKAIGKIFKEF